MKNFYGQIVPPTPSAGVLPTDGGPLYPARMAKVLLGQVLKKKKITKYEFAKRLGMPYRHVFRLFGPKVDPKLSTLSKWSKALGVKIKDLYRE